MFVCVLPSVSIVGLRKIIKFYLNYWLHFTVTLIWITIDCQLTRDILKLFWHKDEKLWHIFYEHRVNLGENSGTHEG